jgi:polysaccharide biosynthesis protein VpsJ
VSARGVPEIQSLAILGLLANHESEKRRMVSMMASVSERVDDGLSGSDAKSRVYDSIQRLAGWLERNDYKGYDTFDGLNANIRPLTFNNPFLLTVLQQGVRRFPLNTRPLLGIAKSHSTKGMGFLARGFMRMQDATGQEVWGEKAKFALQWLRRHQSPGYSGACWGNHFDYQSRSFYLPKGVPTVVWTSLIGHAFLDAYQHFQDESFLQVAVSACEHILEELDTFADGDGLCISYIPTENKQVHNANTLGASLLARNFSFTGNEAYCSLARSAMHYTAQYQRADGSWYYGEQANLHWVDNFHTAYVLDCFKHYQDATGDAQFEANMMRGYHYWKATFFLEDGTPRYYDRKTLPLDIQCSSQAIDTLVHFYDRDPDSLALALQVADWTIHNMQDSSGYFYYRRYSKWLVNKTPTLHWGQATMLCALAGLYRLL